MNTLTQIIQAPIDILDAFADKLPQLAITIIPGSFMLAVALGWLV